LLTAAGVHSNSCASANTRTEAKLEEQQRLLMQARLEALTKRYCSAGSGWFLEGLPKNLSTDPKYMDDFGE
jgi:hypothetical protein